MIYSGLGANGGPRLAEMVIDGSGGAAQYPVIGSAETGELSLVHYQNTGGAAARIIDIDFLEAWQWIDRNG